MTAALERLDELLAGDAEADEVLRATTELLVGEPGVAWAGIAFLEDGQLVLGPAAGTPHEPARQRLRIAFHGKPVGELQVDGEAEPALLAEVARRIAELVLVGWDTGGEAWVP